MIVPRLLIRFADFPHERCPPCRAASPRALMRFGTTGVRPLQRAARVAHRATLPTPAPGSRPRCVAAVAVRVATQHPVPRVSARLPYRRRITSSRGRTRLCTVLNKLLLPRSAPHAPPRPSAQALPRHARARLPHRSAGGLAGRVSAIHFPPTAVRRVRRNTFLSGCRPPWPPPRCPNRSCAFALCPSSGRSSPAEVRPSLRPTLTAGRPLAHAGPGARSRRPPRAFGVCRQARILSTARPRPHAAVLRDISAGTSYQIVRLVFRHYAHVPPAS